MPIVVTHGSEILQAVQTVLGADGSLPYVLLYVGPDQILPLASVFSAIVGVALMFWQRLMGVVRKVLGIFRRRPETPQSDPTLGNRV